MKRVVVVPVEIIEKKIYVIRGQKVMLDSDLAELYEVQTFRLNEAVKRNKNRFPLDFMFKLTDDETRSLRSQFAILKRGQHKKYLPYAFTEQGVAMLSSVLKSKRAVETSIAIVRAFIKLREMLQSHKDILIEIEKIKKDQKKHDEKVMAIMNAINRLLEPKPISKKAKIGFVAK